MLFWGHRLRRGKIIPEDFITNREETDRETEIEIDDDKDIGGCSYRYCRYRSCTATVSAGTCRNAV